MKVKITIEVSLDDLKEYQRESYELNGEELTVEHAKKIYTEMFLADKNDYIDPDEIQVYFV